MLQRVRFYIKAYLSHRKRTFEFILIGYRWATNNARYMNKYPEATPQDMATLKHFAKFIALAIRGRVKEDNPQGRPTVDSV